MKYILISLMIFFVNVTVTLAQKTPSPTLSLSLNQCIQLADENSYSLKVAKLKEEEASSLIKETVASGLPQVNITADYQNFIQIPTQVASADAFGFPAYLTNFFGDLSTETGVIINAPPFDPNAISEFQFGMPHSANAGVTATQLIFSGSYIVGVQASRVIAETRRVSTTKTRIQTHEAVSQAYHTALAAAENHAMLMSSLQLLVKTEKETQALADAGFIEQLDVDQISLSRGVLETELRNSERQEELTISLLLYQIGLPVSSSVKLTDSMDDLIRMNSQLDILQTSTNINQLPSVLEQQHLLELAELNVKNKKAEGLPVISGFYTNSRNAQREEFNLFNPDGRWYPTQVWGLNLAFPVFTSFQGKHRIEKARVQALIAETNFNAVSEGTELELLSAKSDFSHASDAIKEAEKNLDLASRIYENVSLGHAEGVRSSFEFSQASNQLLSSEGALVGARLQWLNSYARLVSATTTHQ